MYTGDKKSDALRILEKRWGYTSFRPMQWDIIESVLDGHDTIGLMPTGGGKSLTFQVPALMNEGLTVVISPLISLMKDQVDRLHRQHIKAYAIHSGLTRAESSLAYERARLGVAKIIYLSPEKLASPAMITEIAGWDVSLLVVDEAHCISQWGYDFRPSYLNIHSLRERLPNVPILALTASATPDVVKDIADKLRLSATHRVFRMSFDRANINYLVRHCDDKNTKLLEILRNTYGSAIVYVRSRRKAQQVARMLVANGMSADYYHAGLDPHDKDERQTSWSESRTRIIVATTAFGMGIDKSDVRVVVHYDPPSSLEEYYQEAGRAGRDNKRAFAVMLAGPTDRAVLHRRITEEFPDKEYIKRVYELLGNYLDVAVGEGYGHVFECNFSEFCTRFNLPERMTMSALKILTRSRYIEYVELMETRARTMILLNKSELYNLRLSRLTEAIFVTLQRDYTGLFADFVPFSEEHIARHVEQFEGMKCSVEDVYQSMLELSRMHVVSYIPRKSSPYVTYTTSRELPQYVQIPRYAYEDLRTRMQTRMDAMLDFIYNDTRCRASILLEYFGEDASEHRCGVCDYCRSTRKPTPSDVEYRHTLIDRTLRSQREASVAQLVRLTGLNADVIIEYVRELSQQGVVEIDGTVVRLYAGKK